MSVFSVPMLQSQPADRALPQIRWLFSRGSHAAPQAGIISCASFLYLAFKALPSGEISEMLSHAVRGGVVIGYLAGAVLTISIAPVTAKLMFPDPDLTLIKMNARLGGRLSQKVTEEECARPRMIRCTPRRRRRSSSTRASRRAEREGRRRRERMRRRGAEQLPR